MNYSRIALLGGPAAAALLAGCPGSSDKPGGKDWTHWTCGSKAIVEWHYINDNKNIVDLHLKNEGDVVHCLEQEPAVIGASYSNERLGFCLKNDEGLVYWVKTGDLISRGYKARRVAPAGARCRSRSSQGT